MSDDVHRSARAGYTSAAETYAKGRPGYPVDVDQWLAQRLGLVAGTRAIDVGAGTGKFTVHLVATGTTTIVLEPVPAMLTTLRRALPDVHAVAATAQAMPFGSGSVDAIVCAQSFHWFASPEVLAEFHRVLRPGGALGLIWNVRDSRVEWVARIGEIVNRLDTHTPRFHTGAWRTAFTGSGFSPLLEERFAHTHTGTPEDVILNRVRSTSFIAAMDDDARALVDQRVKQVIDTTPALAGRAVVAMPYETIAISTRRR